MDEATCPAGGWMSYVEDFPSYTIDLPDGLIVDKVDSGTLVSTTAQRFSTEDAEDRTRAAALNAALAPVRSAEHRPGAGIRRS
jgi:hypothetical protein